MQEVINLEVDRYAVKKCLMEYRDVMKDHGISVSSFTDLTWQNELFDESDCSFKYNVSIDAGSQRDDQSTC